MGVNLVLDDDMIMLLLMGMKWKSGPLWNTKKEEIIELENKFGFSRLNFVLFFFSVNTKTAFG